MKRFLCSTALSALLSTSALAQSANVSSAPPNYSAGGTQAQSMTTTGGLRISQTASGSPGDGIVPVVSQGVSTLLGKAAPGNLYTAYVTATADTWLMVFNSTTAPTNGTVTAGTASGDYQDCIKVPSGTSASVGGLPIPESFSVGIYYALSSTACPTLTLATTGTIHGMQK